MLDKLDIKTGRRIYFDEFQAHLSDVGLCLKSERLNNGYLWMRVTAPDQEFSVLLNSIPNDQGRRFFNGINTNPSHFPSFNAFAMFMTSVFGNIVWSYPVSRIDPAIDLLFRFSDVATWIDVKFKRDRDDYAESESSKDTGLYYGSGDSIIVVYCNDSRTRKDKKLDSRPSNSTRLEARLWRSHLPKPKTLLSVCEYVQNENFKPFELIRLTPQVFKTHDFSNYGECVKATELRTMAQTKGFGYARRKLNSNRNFERNYRKLITLTQPPIMIQAMLRQSIDRWFGYERINLRTFVN